MSRHFLNDSQFEITNRLQNVTSFSSIPYCRNSEYWPQKQTQSGNIHSIILDVHVDWQSTQNFPQSYPIIFPQISFLNIQSTFASSE